MSESILRIGVLSTAKIGTEKVIPGIAKSSRCRVDAIASRSIDSAQATAARLGIARAHGSYEELLADPDIDAVYNPLPEPPPHRVEPRCDRGGQARARREAVRDGCRRGRAGARRGRAPPA